jgi:hemerythrin-like domain-containing protein
MITKADIDHDTLQIEKVLKAMGATIPLLKSGKIIPEPVISQVIDFTLNFIVVCHHHGKEENSLFPELEKKWIKRESHIAVMLTEHTITRKIAARMIHSL